MDTIDYLAWRDSDHHREMAWALSLGFDHADDYHAASKEAFAEAQYELDDFGRNAE